MLTVRAGDMISLKYLRGNQTLQTAGYVVQTSDLNSVA